MKNNNLKNGLLSAAVFLTTIIAGIAIISWLSTEMGLGGFCFVAHS